MNDKNEMSGELLARDARFVILVSRFNSLITEKLLTAARDTLLRHGASADRIDIVRVPGAFELPLAARVLAAGGKYDAIVALGCVIRGATPHFDYVAGECARGLARVSVEFSTPLGFGVLTVDTIEQAIERAGTKGGNKGADAALSALEMADLMKKLE